MKIYLASLSPRRQALLKQINVSFELVSSEIDESVLKGEIPLDYAYRIARSKATAAWSSNVRASNIPLLAADTSVVVGGRILGKPATRDEAFEMLRLLSDNCHEVLSSVAVINDNKTESMISITEVVFRSMSEGEIYDYIDTGDCFDKAGGYGIQGYAAKYIKSISGSYSGVMGLPLFETANLLAKFQDETQTENR